MLRKRFSTIISLVLLVAIAVTFLTGFVAAALDINRFAYHKYAAYLVIAVAAVHVVLHWRTLVAQVRKWLLGLSPTGVPRSEPAASGTPPAARSGAGVPQLSRRAVFSPGLFFVAGVGAGQWWASRAGPPVLEQGQDLGQVYHQWSKPTYLGLLTKSVHARPQPSPYKEYPDVPVVTLPPLPPPGGPPLEEVLAQRRSVREYATRPVKLAELSRLLHASTGITDRRDPTYAFRTVPSSGALFPIELYTVLFNVEGAPPGVYHYDVQRHRLELVRAGNFRQEVFQAAISQEMILHTGLVVVLTGLFARVQWKYVDRSYRYVMLEAGHLGQNVYLAATALGLGACGIGAFFDDDLNRLLGLDGWEEAVVYLLAVGPT